MLGACAYQVAELFNGVYPMTLTELLSDFQNEAAAVEAAAANVEAAKSLAAVVNQELVEVQQKVHDANNAITSAEAVLSAEKDQAATALQLLRDALATRAAELLIPWPEG